MFRKIIFMILIIIIFFSLNTKANLIINSSLCQEFNVVNKEILEGNIITKNGSNQPIKVKLYKRDYTFNANGENYYIKPGQHIRSNSSWINLQNNRITLRPNETKTIGYRIEVPVSKKSKGTYWSMIMVEEYETKSGIQEMEEDIDVKQNIRYGIQVITHFNQSGQVNLHYQNPNINKVNDNRYNFEVDVINKGEAAIKADIKLLLVNKETGEIYAEVKQKARRIYPGTSIKVAEEFQLSENKKYKLILVLGNEVKGFFGKEYLFEVDYAQ